MAGSGGIAQITEPPRLLYASAGDAQQMLLALHRAGHKIQCSQQGLHDMSIGTDSRHSVLLQERATAWLKLHWPEATGSLGIAIINAMKLV